MDAGHVKDMTATTVGGGLGLDQIYLAINDLMTDGATGQEWLALAKGIGLIIFGFFSWRKAL